MSAIHERRYRLQREREIAQRRVRETTLQYVERYENILNDLNHRRNRRSLTRWSKP